MNTAVVGLGAMGRRIARRLLDGGHAVAVWNRSPERARELVDAGATPATTPADAARRSELVIVMVADPAALAAVTESPQGICAGVGDGTIVVSTSTVGPAAVRRLAGLLPPGVALLDAPVLGSLSEVESGTLTIFVGGDERDLERAAPALDVLGATIHVGGIGAGSAAKLVANSTLFGVLGVVGEALAAADALGLSREKTFAVLAATPVAAQAERRRASIEGDDYPTRFALSLAHKDADLLAAAVEAGDLRLFEAARSWLADADAAGRGEQDYASMLEQILSENERASSSG